MRCAADGGSVGLSSLGPTFPVGAGSFRALRNRGRPKAQESHRMGLPASYVGEALVTTTRDSSRSRQHLRLDAALYEPAPPRYPGQLGRPRLKGDRLANLCVVAENPEAE